MYCRYTVGMGQWGSPSASDPRAKTTGQRATKGTVLTSRSLSLWCDCRRLGSTLASWRWQGINVGNPLWRRTLFWLRVQCVIFSNDGHEENCSLPVLDCSLPVLNCSLPVLNCCSLFEYRPQLPVTWRGPKTKKSVSNAKNFGQSHYNNYYNYFIYYFSITVQ